MISSKRITLVDKEKMKIDLEYNETYAILHLPFCKMSKETYWGIQETVHNIWEFVDTLGFEAIHMAISPSDKPTGKLVSKVLKAKYLGSADGLDVYEYKGAS